MNTDSNFEISALRNQVFTLLVALVVVSGTLMVYLYNQTTTLGKELDASKQMINNFNQSQPAIMAFANQLGAYGVNHPDIRPILSKYGIVAAPTQPLPPGMPKK